MKNFLLLLCLFAFNSSAQSYNTDPRVHEINDKHSGINQSNDVFEPTKKRTCSINYSCLEELEVLLDKENDEGAYRVCKDSYSEHKNCCSSPSSCVKDYAPDFSPLNTSFDLCSDKSQLNSTSQNIINKTCEVAEEQCPVECDKKLEELTKKFKTCFNLKFKDSITNKLLQAKKNPTDICYKKMLEMDKKYKKTFLKKTSIKDELKSKEVIKCKEISDFKQRITTAKTNSFICSYIKQRQDAQNKKAKQNNKPDQKAQAKPTEQDSPLVEGYQFFTVEDKKRVDKEFLERQMNREKRKEEEKQKKQKELEDKALERKKLVLKHKEHLDKIEKSKEEERIKKFGKRRKKSGLNYEAIEQMEKEEAERNGVKGRTLRVGAAIVAGASTALVAIKNLPAKTLTKLKQTFSAKAQITQINSPLGVPNKNLQKFIIKKGVLCENIIRNVQLFQSVESPQIESDPGLSPNFTERFVFKGIHLKTRGKRPSRKDIFNNFDIARKKDSYIKITFNSLLDGDLKLYYKLGNLPHQKQSQYSESWVSKNLDSEHKISKQGFPYKIMKLPTNEDIFSDKIGRAYMEVEFTAINSEICKDPISNQSRARFQVNLWDTKELEMNFITIDTPPNCKHLNASNFMTSSTQKVKDMATSFEVEEFIPAIFPIAKKETKIRYNSEVVNGSCDNSAVHFKSSSKGFLNDIAWAEHIGSLNSHNRITKNILVVPKEYRDFHNKNLKKGFQTPWDGLVVSKQPATLNPFSKKTFGSWNVTFVVDTALNQGVISHELGHTFGQLTEFYPPIQGSPQKQKYCRDFINEQLIECYRYRISESLKSGQIFKNQISIMEGLRPLIKIQNTLVDKLKKYIWIDRNTYQVALSNLLTPLSVKYFDSLYNKGEMYSIDELSPPEGLEEEQLEKNISKPVILFSGVYLTDTKEVINLTRSKAIKGLQPSPSVYSNKFSNEADIKIRIRSKDQLYETKVVSQAKVEYFLKNGNIVSKPLKAVPISFAFPLDDNDIFKYTMDIDKLGEDGDNEKELVDFLNLKNIPLFKK